MGKRLILVVVSSRSCEQDTYRYCPLSDINFCYGSIRSAQDRLPTLRCPAKDHVLSKGSSCRCLYCLDCCVARGTTGSICVSGNDLGGRRDPLERDVFVTDKFTRSRRNELDWKMPALVTL
jgi:hypothetical protein